MCLQRRNVGAHGVANVVLGVGASAVGSYDKWWLALKKVTFTFSTIVVCIPRDNYFLPV